MQKHLTAQARRSYKAEVEGQISFMTNDIITNVEKTYEKWWTGTSPNGRRGLFPSDHVQVIDKSMKVY